MTSLTAMPLAEVHPEGAVARQRRHARGDEVADARQPGERRGVAAESQPEPRRLGQAARDDRGLGVVAHAHALGHADREGDDVLDGAAELGADDVGVGVGPEVGRGAGCGDPLRHVARSSHATTLAAGCFTRDLAGEVGPGDDDDPLGLDPADLGDDLAHALGGAELDALHQRDDGGVARQQPTPQRRRGWRAASATARPARRCRRPSAASAGSVVAEIARGRRMPGR